MVLQEKNAKVVRDIRDRVYIGFSDEGDEGVITCNTTQQCQTS